MVIPTLIGNPYNAYINPYDWVDDYPLAHGNNGRLEPITQEIFSTYPQRYDVEFRIEELSGSQLKTPVVLPHGNLISQIKKTHTQKQHQSGGNFRGNSPKSNWIIWGWAWQVDQVSCKLSKACWGHWGWEKKHWNSRWIMKANKGCLLKCGWFFFYCCTVLLSPHWSNRFFLFWRNWFDMFIRRAS